MSSILDRFVRYVKLDTQSDETSPSSPSTSKQLELSRLLVRECQELGLENVSLSDRGVLLATIPATVSHEAPTIAFVTHVDTSPEFSGTGVKPVIHENYRGGDIVLPGDPSRIIRVEDNPTLNELIGETIVTTDGTTLLGADDKAGIAVMMAAAEFLQSHPEIPHGPIRFVFTCDEEIGRGVEPIDLNQVDSLCAYTFDSDGSGRVDAETFSADQAIVTVRGINTHPSVGKNAMVNAIRILSRFLAELPLDHLSPETTDEREGFLHPYHVEGGVASATARLILRDFETEKLVEYTALLESIAEPLRKEFPKAAITIETRRQYRNMREGLTKEPRALQKAIEATRAAGLEPNVSIIRGGTDGSLLTERGLPTPNLSCGQHNPHSPLEWTSVIEMERAVKVMIELCRLWGAERK